MINENLRWLLSYYRGCEIGGALFFGQLAARLKPGQIQIDLTRHFADEAEHARLWTDALTALDAQPIAISERYQDRYLKEAGLPVSLMEVLAVTQVFEQRVIRQYQQHRSQGSLPAPVATALEQIMADERWHIAWVRRALRDMRKTRGDERVDVALERFRHADEQIYSSLATEHADRLQGALS